MRSAGIDIGSRNTKLVVLEDGVVAEWIFAPTGADPLGTVRRLLDGRAFDSITATGYGRKLALEGIAGHSITEIKAAAMGAHRLLPECGSVVDIGGQDTKVIVLDGCGGFTDFAMNDKCAAGTGRFLEMISTTLGYDLDEMGRIACKAEAGLRLSSMCAVFAESEVISLIAGGIDGARIARAVHESVADRIASLARSVGSEIVRPAVSGGVSRNPCVVHLLEKRLGMVMAVHDKSLYFAALGAAIRGSAERDM